MSGRQLHTRASLLGALVVSAACGSGAAEPEAPAKLEFSVPVLELGILRSGQVEVINSGGRAIGPVQILAGRVQDSAGSTIPGSTVATDPGEIPTLNPGDGRTVQITLALQNTLNPGSYDAVVTARGGQESTAALVVRFTVLSEAEEATASVEILAEAVAGRTGDVLPLSVEARDDAGQLLQGVPVTWTLGPASAGFVSGAGHFVGYRTGEATVVARVGAVADTVTMTVTDRGVAGEMTVAARARETAWHTSDLWVHGDVAYTGTWGTRTSPSGQTSFGNTLNVWTLANPLSPTKVFSLEIDARTVNDVKVRADGKLAVITHEGSIDGLNGITILDLDDPLRPSVTGRFTTELQSGVHNVWVEGDYVYVAVDGVGNGLRILDISDPGKPEIVARYYAGDSFLHDVYVRDGLAFLSHWNAGLVILDVGNGIAGGSPSSPVEVSRLTDLGGQTHNAWYWPAAGYVFVGEEDFDAEGVMHVVDVRNLRDPREVATYAVPGETPHNFWLDETRGILYLAWYGNGLRALDVTGTLLGALDRQGREIAGLRYNGGSGVCNRGSEDTCTWAPQLHNGLLWVSDLNEGLIALDPPS